MSKPARGDEPGTLRNFAATSRPNARGDLMRSKPPHCCQLGKPQAQSLEPACVTFEDIVAGYTGKMIRNNYVVRLSGPIRLIGRPVPFACFSRRELADLVKNFHFESPA